ncbi:hypothetical protein NPIL_376441 [Nephila pilipes]|uniref:Uncharacterized protein n=1 Tax=Nephila pilipes TaxID=299642 RepID=A0A8X6NZA2_NEPPI|nr:hypothetical protein NPIL_376441 [Nephila pilipes]
MEESLKASRSDLRISKVDQYSLRLSGMVRQQAQNAEIGFEESEEEVISTSEIKEILGMWESFTVRGRNTRKKLQQAVHLIF